MSTYCGTPSVRFRTHLEDLDAIEYVCCTPKIAPHGPVIDGRQFSDSERRLLHREKFAEKDKRSALLLTSRVQSLCALSQFRKK